MEGQLSRADVVGHFYQTGLAKSGVDLIEDILFLDRLIPDAFHRLTQLGRLLVRIQRFIKEIIMHNALPISSDIQHHIFRIRLLGWLTLARFGSFRTFLHATLL